MDFTLQMVIRLFILLLRPLEDMWTDALRLSDSLHKLCDHYIILLGFLQLLLCLGAHATDADFRQEVPFLVADREDESFGMVPMVQANALLERCW